MTTTTAPAAPAAVGAAGAAAPPAVHADDGVAVVEIHGRLDRRTVVGTLRAVAEAVRRGPDGVVADLSAAQVDPEGLVVLALVRRRVARGGRRFALAGAGPDLTVLLDAARVAALYRSYPSVGDALGAFRSP